MINASTPFHCTQKLKSPGAPYRPSLAGIPGRPGILGIVVYSLQPEPRREEYALELGDNGPKTDIRAGGEFAGCKLRACPYATHSSLAHGHAVTRTGRTYLPTCTMEHVAPRVCILHLNVFANLSAHRGSADLARRCPLAVPDTSLLGQSPWQ